MLNMNVMFTTIEESKICFDPESIIEMHSINNNQSLVLDTAGRKIILNHSFEEIQYYLVDNSPVGKEWIYVTGICGALVMIDPLHIKNIHHANPKQSKIIFDNMKKLYVNMSSDELTKRIKKYK